MTTTTMPTTAVTASPEAAPKAERPETVGPTPKVRKSERRLYLEATFSIIALIHLIPFVAIYTGTRPIDWIVCGVLYFARMFGVTGVYHRYFSHRTYKTSRWFQFVLAFLAETSAQKGALWWASHHRHHHKYSDTEFDTHSPVKESFFYSHIGWLFDDTDDTDWDRIKDFQKYPELVFLNKHWWLPPTLLAVAVFLTLGWSGLIIGFFLSTICLWHGTFFINSLTHVWGYQDYESGDESRNNFILALITMGEGWHNNHHYYQASTRQGFKWWQIDMTYYILKAMSFVGLVWDIREPPASVVDGTRKLSHVDRLKGKAEAQSAKPALDGLADAA